MSNTKDNNQQVTDNIRKKGTTNPITRRRIVIGGSALAAGLTTVGMVKPDRVSLQQPQENNSNEKSATLKLEGKVAVITGGARGMGRAHAVTLAREGANIVICDLAANIKSVPYSLGTNDDMKETARLVEATGRRCLTMKADVRNIGQMRKVIERGISATTNLLRQVVQLALKDKRSPLYGTNEDGVKVENGRLFLAENPARGETYNQLLTRLGQKQVEAIGEWDGKQSTKQYSMHAFGADFAEVAVDPDLGLVRVRRLLGVYSAGRILNSKTARSQVIGGMVWGMSQALLEHTSMDVNFGRYTNANYVEYLVPVHADIPGDIEVEFIDERDRYVNVLGVKGIGELAMVGASAAIANAVYHATGKRIRDLPSTPDKLL